MNRKTRIRRITGTLLAALLGISLSLSVGTEAIADPGLLTVSQNAISAGSVSAEWDNNTNTYTLHATANGAQGTFQYVFRRWNLQNDSGAIGDPNSPDTTFTPGGLRNTATAIFGEEYKVTFRVVNGSWDDGTTGDKVVSLVRDADEDLALTLHAGNIPAVGSLPAAGCTAGAWDTVPAVDDVINENKTFIYTYGGTPSAPGPGPEQTGDGSGQGSAQEAGTVSSVTEDPFAKQSNEAIGKLNEVLALASSAQTPAQQNKLNELRTHGLTLEFDGLTCLGSTAYDRIRRVSEYGIPVIIKFKAANKQFSTVIPAYTTVDPVTLCDKNGFCGFFTLTKSFGIRSGV